MPRLRGLARQRVERGVDPAAALRRIVAHRVGEVQRLRRPRHRLAVAVHVGDEADELVAGHHFGALDRVRRDAEPVRRHQHQRALRRDLVVPHQRADVAAPADVVLDPFDCHALASHLPSDSLTTSPMMPASCPVKNIRPPDVTAMQRAPAFGTGISYSAIIRPSGAMRPILLAKFSVNHSSPSGVARDAAQARVRRRRAMLGDAALRVDAAKAVGARLHEPDRAVGMGDHRARLAALGRDRELGDLGRRR